MSTDPVVHEALTRAVPLRSELAPDWRGVISRAEGRRSRRWRPVLVAAVVTVALVVAGVAIADVVGSAPPLHGATLDVNAATVGGPSGIPTCGLIGKPAGQVAATLTTSGITIEWRFTHWGTTVESKGQGSTPSAVTGGSSDVVSSVPGDSVVWDIDPDGNTKAFVFVEAPNDPNAPTVAVDNCSG